jgi:alkanesulfonate monooxygenase SsuD/methylene tetrahydromethanopterin reductase-like flavin-dependent oxidoreductase (luciferase family)
VIKFGVHVGPQMCTMSELRQAWEVAEESGFEWLSAWDHFYPAPGPLDGDCFEAVACHAALAATTQRVRVGCLVYSAGYRHPAVLAKAGATIDHLSDGRLEMGIGAGWHQPESDAFGIPFEPPGTRLRRMAETIEVVRLLWTQELTDYDGEFFHLKQARCDPKPIQQPPRIWVGALGERRALALAGQLGDGWNAPFVAPDVYARKLEIVKEASSDPGRLVTGVNLGFLPVPDNEVDDALRERFGPAGEVLRGGMLVGSPQAMADRVGQYTAAGAQWVILALRAPFDLDALATFAAEVVPAFGSPATNDTRERSWQT